MAARSGRCRPEFERVAVAGEIRNEVDDGTDDVRRGLMGVPLVETLRHVLAEVILGHGCSLAKAWREPPARVGGNVARSPRSPLGAWQIVEQRSACERAHWLPVSSYRFDLWWEAGLEQSTASEDHHSASRTFTTNQPSLTGASPEPQSSSCASRTDGFSQPG